MAESQVRNWPDEDEINLLEYWRVIWKHKWLVGILTATSVLVALTFSLLSPKIYESEATILAPKEGGGGGILSALGALGATGLAQQFAGMSVPSLTPNRDTLISILKSRTIAQKLVEQFKLKDYYKSKHLEDALRSLQGATRVVISKEGVISIRVEDKDAKLAAEIANAYVDHLDRMMTQFGTGSAGNQRRFISEQLTKAQRGLKEAEEDLRQFQEKNRAVLIGDMANSMRLPTAQVPKVGIELVRLMRELRVQETIYALLTQQLEQARIGEAQDTPVVQILDRAVPAVYKSKPKTVLNMALAGAVSLFLSVFLAFFLEYIARQKQKEALTGS